MAVEEQRTHEVLIGKMPVPEFMDTGDFPQSGVKFIGFSALSPEGVDKTYIWRMNVHRLQDNPKEPEKFAIMLAQIKIWLGIDAVIGPAITRFKTLGVDSFTLMSPDFNLGIFTDANIRLRDVNLQSDYPDWNILKQNNPDALKAAKTAYKYLPDLLKKR